MGAWPRLQPPETVLSRTHEFWVAAAAAALRTPQLFSWLHARCSAHADA